MHALKNGPKIRYRQRDRDVKEMDGILLGEIQKKKNIYIYLKK